MRELSKIQIAEMHVGFQMSSAARISEHGEFYIGSNKFTRGMTRTAAIVVDKLYGLGPWTRAAEIQVGTATRGKFGRVMLKEKLSATDRTELARLGFGDGEIAPVRAQVRAHYEKLTGGVVDIKTASWTDRALADDVNALLSAEVHNVIIKPKTGDTPFIGRTMAGSMALQFKQFPLAATSKYLIADVQKLLSLDFAHAAERQLGFILLGMAQWETRRWLYGIQDEEESLGKKVVTGYSYGGGGGIGMDIANWADQAWGSGANARYRGSRGVTSVMGAWFNTVDDIYDAGQGISNLVQNGELTNEQIKAMYNTIPGRTWIPARQTFNDLEEATKQAYNP